MLHFVEATPQGRSVLAFVNSEGRVLRISGLPVPRCEEPSMRHQTELMSFRPTKDDIKELHGVPFDGSPAEFLKLLASHLGYTVAPR